MTRRWLGDCLRYVHSRLLPKSVWRQAKDGRKNPEILPGTVWQTVLYGFLMQVPSFERLGRLARDGFGRLLPRKQRPPSVDAIRDGMDQADLSGLKRLFVGAMNRIKRMKAVGWLDGWRVAAIDGSYMFTSTLHKCADCRRQNHQNGSPTYNHGGIYCHTVGSPPRLFWGYEPIHPGEGEQRVAIRLLDWLYTQFKHFVDILVFDAGFAGAPVLQTALGYGYHVIVALRDERMLIVRDALGLFQHRAPDLRFEHKRSDSVQVRVTIWDEENFSSWEAIPQIQRVVYVEEVELTGRHQGRLRRLMVGTDLTQGQVGSQSIWKMAHARWVIENTGFHEAKGQWKLDHCYVHTAVGIQAVIWLMMLGINLFRMYVERHSLRAFVASQLTRSEVAERMRGELLYAEEKQGLWLLLGWDST